MPAPVTAVVTATRREQDLRREATMHLTRIARLMPGFELTLVIRNPSRTDDDVILSRDDLHAVLATLKRRVEGSA